MASAQPQLRQTSFALRVAGNPQFWSNVGVAFDGFGCSFGLPIGQFVIGGAQYATVRYLGGRTGFENPDVNAVNFLHPEQVLRLFLASPYGRMFVAHATTNMALNLCAARVNSMSRWEYITSGNILPAVFCGPYWHADIQASQRIALTVVATVNTALVIGNTRITMAIEEHNRPKDCPSRALPGGFYGLQIGTMAAIAGGPLIEDKCPSFPLVGFQLPTARTIVVGSVICGGVCTWLYSATSKPPDNNDVRHVVHGGTTWIALSYCVLGGITVVAASLV